MNYFSVLSNEKATNEELARAYSEIEKMKADLTISRADEYQALVKIQQDALGGNGSASQLKKGKETLSDIDLKLDACDDALNQIKQRMIDQSPAEIKAGISAVEQILGALHESEQKVRREFLNLMAKAVSVKAHIEGENFFYAQSSGEHLPIRYPGIEFSPTGLKEDDLNFYHQACDEYRVPDDSFTIRRNRLMREKDKLESILTGGDFGGYIENMIAAA